MKAKEIKSNKKIRLSRGFTVVELMVAMTLFTIVIFFISSLFVQAIRSQRIISERVTAIDNAALVLEQIAREIRTGIDFQIEGVNDTLAFTNYAGSRIRYHWNRDSSSIEKKIGDLGEYRRLTAEDIRISQMRFSCIPTNCSLGSSLPRILITIKAESPLFKSPVNLETTVSARLFRYR